MARPDLVFSLGQETRSQAASAQILGYEQQLDMEPAPVGARPQTALWATCVIPEQDVERSWIGIGCLVDVIGAQAGGFGSALGRLCLIGHLQREANAERRFGPPHPEQAVEIIAS